MTTFDELAQLIHEKFGVEPATLYPATALTEFGLDSLTLVELVFTIEEHFGIEIPDDADIKTLTDVTRLIDELRTAKVS